jgi:hypothetical protein
MTFETFITGLPIARKTKNGIVTTCPAHRDDLASLSIARGTRGKVSIVLRCFAGCRTEDVVRGLGREMRDLFHDLPPVNGTGRRKATEKAHIVKSYRYVDEGGALLYEVVRFQPKAFRQRRPDGVGGWIWNLDGVRRVVYYLSELRKRKAKGVLLLEGEKDVAAAWSHGIPATTTAGGANGFEGHAADFLAQLRWAGAKTLVLCPDNDEPGRDYMRAWAAAAKADGFAVRWLALDGLPEKGDLSDWLAMGHTADELRSLMATSPELEPEPSPSSEPTTSGLDPAPTNDRYVVRDGHLCRRRETREGTMFDPLCNFTAEIIEEIAQDDGVETSRVFMIAGQSDEGRRFPVARVPVARFAGMNWVPEHWGLRAIVRAGMSTRDCLRDAIQTLSRSATSRHVFTHTGWRELGAEWVYLHADGAVGGTGYEVDLGEEEILHRYRLPTTPEDPIGAVRASLELIRSGFAPKHVTWPLWGAVYRAPTASLLPVDVTPWLHGPTGNLKTTLTALILSHFGDWDRLHLPASWAGTLNSLEKLAFKLKDIPLVVDDYAPRSHDQRDLEFKAAGLIRAQGNRSSRSRLRADLTDRRSFPPRGVLIVTGEQLPSGPSTLARILGIELDRSQIKLDILDRLQGENVQPRLPHAMAAYLGWLAPQMATLKADLTAAFVTNRQRATSDATGSEIHLRVPEAVAHLWLGIDLGLKFAMEIGACTKSEADELCADAWETLLQLSTTQGALIRGEQPTHRFLKVIAAQLSQGTAVLLNKEISPDAYSGKATRIGWQDDECLYLQPETTWRAVTTFCRETGEPFPVREDRLRRDLVKEGLMSQPPEGRYTNNVRCGGRKRVVFRIDRKAAEAILGEAFPEPWTSTSSRGYEVP